MHSSDQFFILMIVAMVMIAGVLKSIFRGPRHPVVFNNEGQTKIENQRLREEVTELKERIKVLERITIEKENSLAREIDSLRDR